MNTSIFIGVLLCVAAIAVIIIGNQILEYKSLEEYCQKNKKLKELENEIWQGLLDEWEAQVKHYKRQLAEEKEERRKLEKEIASIRLKYPYFEDNDKERVNN